MTDRPLRPGLAATTVACLAASMAMSIATAALGADDAWSFFEAPVPGGPRPIPSVATQKQDDRRVAVSAECRSGYSDPSVYITVKEPGSDLRQLRFDTPIPVTFRWQPTAAGKPAPAEEVRVTGKLSSGVSPHTNYIVVGIGSKDGGMAATFLGRNPGPEEATARAVITIQDTSVTLNMRGADRAFATLRRNCPPP